MFEFISKYTRATFFNAQSFGLDAEKFYVCEIEAMGAR
jgi:hypothetical protein